MHKKLAIIGYSGHSYVCINAALLCGFEITGYFDVKKKLNPYNLKFLGSDNNTNNSGQMFICVGDNKLRKTIYSRTSNTKLLSTSIIHPNSTISSDFNVNPQTFISAHVLINPKVIIGKGCIINSASVLEHECKIGDFTHIAPNVTLCGNVTIGNNCFIGAGAIIIQGVTIGNNVTVGAGSIVLKNVKNNCTVYGNPARLKRNN